MISPQVIRQLEALEELMGANDDAGKLTIQVVFHNVDGTEENGPLIEIPLNGAGKQ
jgi:hypothetical protein